MKEARPSHRTTSPNEEFSFSSPSRSAIITERRVVNTAVKDIAIGVQKESFHLHKPRVLSQLGSLRT